MLIRCSFVGVVGFAAQECLYNVDGGERAIIFDRFQGVYICLCFIILQFDDFAKIKEGIKDEGTHIRIPLLQYPYIFDIRSKPRVINTQTGTKDLQVVSIAVRNILEVCSLLIFVTVKSALQTSA